MKEKQGYQTKMERVQRSGFLDRRPACTLVFVHVLVFSGWWWWCFSCFSAVVWVAFWWWCLRFVVVEAWHMDTGAAPTVAVTKNYQCQPLTATIHHLGQESEVLQL